MKTNETTSNWTPRISDINGQTTNADAWTIKHKTLIENMQIDFQSKCVPIKTSEIALQNDKFDYVVMKRPL